MCYLRLYRVRFHELHGAKEWIRESLIPKLSFKQTGCDCWEPPFVEDDGLFYLQGSDEKSRVIGPSWKKWIGWHNLLSRKFRYSKFRPTETPIRISETSVDEPKYRIQSVYQHTQTSWTSRRVTNENVTILYVLSSWLTYSHIDPIYWTESIQKGRTNKQHRKKREST